MPKYRPETEKMKALALAKDVTKCKGNLSATARKRGVETSTIARNIQRPAVQKALAEINAELLDKAGATDKVIYQTLSDQLKANKVISCNVIAGDGEGMKDANSMTKDFVDVPDNTARHNAVNTCLKLKGRFPEERKEESGPTIINVVPMVVIKTAPLAFDLGA